jgi:2-oxoglutarate dehydrogenase E2 component (dihydrolipoamide succinyltransferase)
MSRPVPVVIERENVNDETVVLTRWFVTPDAWVESGTLIAEIETSKATVEIHAPAPGYIRYTAKEGQEIPVGQELCLLLPDLQAPENAAENSEAANKNSNGSGIRRPAPAVSLERERSETQGSILLLARAREENGFPNGAAKRFSSRAAELVKRHNLKPELFAHRTLVRERDVREILDVAAVPAAEPYRESRDEDAARGSAHPFPREPHRIEPLPARKRAEIRQISLGSRGSLASSVSVACLTRGFRRALEKNPLLAGSTGAVVIYEVSRLLRKYPAFNAVYRPGVICVYDRVNIGFALDDGRGLKVPILAECDRLSLSEIAGKMKDLTVAYLEDHLSTEDLSGGTFTVSDLSALDVTHFSPLPSGDQSAILGVGSEVFLPGATSGLFHLTLVFDHQLSEGRTAALFLNELKLRLESYESAMSPVGTDNLPERSCARCLRPASELAAIGGCLLQSAAPSDFICSLCVLGY